MTRRPTVLAPAAPSPPRLFVQLFLLLTYLAAPSLAPSLAAAHEAQEAAAPAAPPEALPQPLTPVNDLANVLDAAQRAELDRISRSLEAKTGDVVVVATVPTFAPYGSLQEYAVKLFENQGRGIGQKGKDNGLLVLLAVQDRKVWVEVGYDLEGFVTDGFAGETSRQYMVPHFRSGNYGEGLSAGVSRLVGRIAEGRGVTVEDLRMPAAPQQRTERRRIPIGLYIFLAIVLFNVIRSGFDGGGPRRGRRGPWGGSGWSGWSGGVGPFGGGGGSWGGGFGGGGGGGFGGGGGGRSGGGGGGAGW